MQPFPISSDPAIREEISPCNGLKSWVQIHLSFHKMIHYVIPLFRETQIRSGHVVHSLNCQIRVFSPPRTLAEKSGDEYSQE